VKKMQLDFQGKRVLVTGSTMGIGLGIAEAFHLAGATVAINGRSGDSVAKAIAALGGGSRLVAAPGDFGSSVERNAALDKLLRDSAGLDILVNNAGLGEDCPVDAITEAYWERLVALNLKGAFFASQTCLPALRASRGCIINVSSGLGLMAGFPGTIVYCMTKSAMIQMTKSMAFELAADGVRVNSLIPGWTDTPMIRRENEKAGNNALVDYINYTTPAGRAGTVEECAGAALYLAAPFASFTTGAALVVDGGLTAGRYI
jgi:NAD(P)-dependent dehydrogenase (short-subunit alcohol dehydrogenase family)